MDLSLRLRSLDVGTRLALVLGLFVVLVLLIASSAANGLSRMAGAGRDAVANDVAFSQATGGIRYRILSLRRFEKDALLNAGSPDQVRAYREKWRVSAARLAIRMDEASALATGGERDEVARLKAGVTRYTDFMDQLFDALSSGAVTSASDANARLEPVKNAIREAENLANDLNAAAVLRIEGIVPVLDATERNARAMLIAGATFAALLALIAGVLVARSIRRPLDEVARVVHGMAHGDFTTQVDSRGRDEIAGVLRALGTTLDALSATVGRVRDGARQVSDGTGEISHGNLDLSARTEQQAANIQQTAATLEELVATVRRNAEGAGQASRLAGDVVRATESGGRMAERVIGTMNGIQGSARRIAAIIGSIDGIAFQTNILALNAAVEAARAGEQGRGFAVVAAEVRALSARSADAAREIRAIAEETVGQVDGGVALASETGAALQEAVSRVKRLSGLLDEISEASAGQSTGLEQVGQAVSALDETTQRNAALVEELAAATRGLDEQSRLLADRVAIFRVRALPPA